MIKVCFFNLNAFSIFDPASKASIGGTEVQLFNIANYLSNSNDLEIDFIVGDWGQKDIEIYNKIKIYKSVVLKRNILNYVKAPFIIWNILNKINADVYISSSAGADAGFMALFCKLRNKKFIYRTAHDIDCNKEFAKNNGLFGKIFEYGLKNATKIISQNKRNAKMLKDNYGIDAEIIHNVYEISSKEINKNNYVLWVGRCQKWKNPKMFLDIAEKIPEVNFIMISPKQKNEIDLYEKVTKRAEQIKNLKFIEKIPFNKIQKYFDEAFLFIGTSKYEGFPNTYLQACIGKTPIVSYRVNPDNFITENNLGYCCDGDFNLMIENIKIFFSDNEFWKEKSENAYKYVKNNHDIRVIGKQWEKIIKKLI